jgi:hypothetical protein
LPGYLVTRLGTDCKSARKTGAFCHSGGRALNYKEVTKTKEKTPQPDRKMVKIKPGCSFVNGRGWTSSEREKPREVHSKRALLTPYVGNVLAFTALSSLHSPGWRWGNRML